MIIIDLVKIKGSVYVYRKYKHNPIGLLIQSIKPSEIREMYEQRIDMHRIYAQYSTHYFLFWVQTLGNYL